MAKWKKMAEFTSNPRVFRIANFQHIEHSGYYHKWEYANYLRHGRPSKYKSRRKGRC